MEIPQKPAKAIHTALWLAQVILACAFVWASAEKLFRPVQSLAAMWPWAGQVPAALVKLTGVVDLSAAIGLILPALLRIRPNLTPIAAICIIVLMICASIFHIMRGEASVIGVNIFFALMAAFIAWGRMMKAPIAPK